MKLNLGHVKSLAGILKTAGLIIGVIAAALGASAFNNSPYNQSCRDSVPFLPPAGNSTNSTQSTIPSDRTTLPTRAPITTSLVQNPKLVPFQDETSPPSSSTTGQSSTTGNPNDEEGDKDMAPVLWMERFQISITCITVICSAGLLITCILSEDMEFSKIFRGVNFGFHFVSCVFLIISAIFIAYAATEIDNKICSADERFVDNMEDCQKYKQKMSAAAFTFLEAIIYAGISVQILGKKLYEQV
ncbi:unnamed protein product [Orchesella dallaii]|uniref:MARVEL domain-containing protein n=1 Tax=Orchesella dallaii TaxID=48710 RepID=A0ABP1QFN0_9HEXA